jgi:hypothetical protein
MCCTQVSAPGSFLLNTNVKLEVAMWQLDRKGRSVGEKLFPLKLVMDSFIIGLTAGTVRVFRQKPTLEDAIGSHGHTRVTH